MLICLDGKVIRLTIKRLMGVLSVPLKHSPSDSILLYRGDDSKYIKNSLSFPTENGSDRDWGDHRAGEKKKKDIVTG